MSIIRTVSRAGNVAGQVLKNPAIDKTIVRTNFNQVAVSTGPRNRISFTEKVVLGGIMCLSVVVTPVYILLNLKNYKGSTRG